MKKEILTGVFGTLIAAVSTFWVGLEVTMQTLIAFMAADYLTGLIVAGVFKRSKKSQHGALESRAGIKGLFRKSAVLLAVYIAHQLDAVLDTNFIMQAVIISYIINESISLIENIGLMGVPVPSQIMGAIDVLKSKNEGESRANH